MLSSQAVFSRFQMLSSRWSTSSFSASALCPGLLFLRLPNSIDIED